MRIRSIGLATLLAVALLAGACSSNGEDDGGDGAGGGAEEGSSTSVTTDAEAPQGPTATFSGPLEGGAGIALATAGTGPDLDEAGYTEAEYVAAGTATSYASAEPLPADGTYELEPAEEADYATRVVVRRPADAEDFNGTVVVEWLNVSSGADAAPDYTYLAEEVLRGGYAWAGVSAQRIGIEGGDVAVAVPGAEGLGLGQGLRAQDPERYGDLHHPGDAFSYDIYTQVGRALRSPGNGGDGGDAGNSGDSGDAGGAGGVAPLDGLEVARVLAIGESQSAFALTTYVNGVQPLTGAFDGFLVHARGGAAAALGEPDAGIDIAGTIGGEPTTIRTDIEVPVMVVQSETDVLGLLNYFPARQPDNDHFRLWEMAGTAHADTFQVGSGLGMLECATPINAGQQVFVMRAALRHLDTWVAEGTAPPEAPRLEVDESGEAPAFVLDEVGNVEGGIRSPVVDAPVDVLSGLPAEGSSVICMLMGSTTPLGEDRLRDLYPSPDDYLSAYEAATDEMIEAGFALEEDREQILAGASPDRIPG